MLTPASEAELSEAVAAAGAPCASGRWHAARRTAGDREALSVAGLTGVELYEPGALTIVARAGTPLAEIEALLAKENQRLPFEPMDHRALLGTDGRADHRRRGGGQCVGPAADTGGRLPGQSDRGALRRWHGHGSEKRRAGDEECHRL
jgi:FAD/FMN-containing dehydrogenase